MPVTPPLPDGGVGYQGVDPTALRGLQVELQSAYVTANAALQFITTQLVSAGLDAPDARRVRDFETFYSDMSARFDRMISHLSADEASSAWAPVLSAGDFQTVDAARTQADADAQVLRDVGVSPVQLTAFLRDHVTDHVGDPDYAQELVARIGPEKLAQIVDSLGDTDRTPAYASSGEFTDDAAVHATTAADLSTLSTLLGTATRAPVLSPDMQSFEKDFIALDHDDGGRTRFAKAALLQNGTFDSQFLASYARATLTREPDGNDAVIAGSVSSFGLPPGPDSLVLLALLKDKKATLLALQTIDGTTINGLLDRTSLTDDSPWTDAKGVQHSGVELYQDELGTALALAGGADEPNGKHSAGAAGFTSTLVSALGERNNDTGYLVPDRIADQLGPLVAAYSNELAWSADPTQPARPGDGQPLSTLVPASWVLPSDVAAGFARSVITSPGGAAGFAVGSQRLADTVLPASVFGDANDDSTGTTRNGGLQLLGSLQGLADNSFTVAAVSRGEKADELTEKRRELLADGLELIEISNPIGLEGKAAEGVWALSEHKGKEALVDAILPPGDEAEKQTERARELQIDHDLYASYEVARQLQLGGRKSAALPPELDLDHDGVLPPLTRVQDDDAAMEAFIAWLGSSANNPDTAPGVPSFGTAVRNRTGEISGGVTTITDTLPADAEEFKKQVSAAQQKLLFEQFLAANHLPSDTPMNDDTMKAMLGWLLSR